MVLMVLGMEGHTLPWPTPPPAQPLRMEVATTMLILLCIPTAMAVLRPPAHSTYPSNTNTGIPILPPLASMLSMGTSKATGRRPWLEGAMSCTPPTAIPTTASVVVCSAVWMLLSYQWCDCMALPSVVLSTGGMAVLITSGDGVASVSLSLTLSMW